MDTKRATGNRGGPGRGQGNRKDDVTYIILSEQARQRLNALVAHRRALAGTKLSHKEVVETLIEAAWTVFDETPASPTPAHLDPQR